MLKNKLIITITGFYIFWLFILPPMLSGTVDVFCQNISHNSPYNIEVLKPEVKLSVLPIMTFHSDKLSIKSKTDENSVVVNNLKISTRLLPLLSGNLHINSLNLDSLALNAELNKNPELDKDFIKKLEKTRVKIDSLNITDYKINFYQKGITNPIIYQGKDLIFQRRNRYIKLKINSELNIENNISKATLNLYLPKNNDIKKTVFDADIDNINITPLKIYLKHYLPPDLKELKGLVNIRANKDELTASLEKVSVIMKDSAKSIIFPNIMTVKSKFHITRQFINFEYIDIESKNIHAALNGKLFDYFGKSMPSLDFNVCLNKSQVEDIINMLPAFKVEEIDVYKLKKYKFYGETLANFSVKGRLPEPDIIGDIYINDGILTKPIPNTSKGASIKLKMTGKHVNFDVFVPAGGVESVEVKGTQELYNIKYADMTIKSTSSVDLKVAQNVLNPLHEVLNFIIGPVPIMDINGKGNIDIIVKGNRRNPHVWGIFNVKKGLVRFNEIPDLKLVNADAVLKFNDQNALFTSTNGFVNEKNFVINGTCDLYGKFDFDVKSKNQPTEKLYKAISTSTMIPEVKQMIPQMESIKGFTDLDLKIFGSVKDIADLKFNTNAFAKGKITLKNNDVSVNTVKIDKINGIVTLDALNADADIKALAGGLPLAVKAKIKSGFADVFVDIPKLNPNFLINDKSTAEKQYLPNISANARYRGNVDKFETSKLNLNAKILGSNPSAAVKFQPSGTINISKNKINIQNIKGYIGNNTQNSFDVDLIINDAFSNNPVSNGFIKLKTPNLELYNDILHNNVLPESIKKYTKNYKFGKGKLNFNARITDNRLNAYTDLSGISFVYLPLDLPIDIINGNIYVKNNMLRLNKINLLADKMPLLIDGEVKDIFEKQKFNIYFNSKPNQDFLDKYINKNQIYPIKIKGDIVYWIRFKGVPENYDFKAKVNMNKDSSVYYFGATVGDVENAIEVSMDSKVVEGNNHKIKEFSYDKIIDSQSGKQTHLNMLKAWGGVKILKDDLAFDNLYIKTNHPTDARIFNIIFRKPNLKQGQFTSDLKFNGKLSNPKILGNFHIFEANLPFLDTTMKNIELVFKDKIIEFESKGDILGNDIIFNGVLKNKLIPPYKIEQATLYTKDLDLNQIVNKLKAAEVEEVTPIDSIDNFDLKTVVSDNFKLKADNIKLRNIYATDFEALTGLSENGVFNVDKFKFNIAQGSLEGKYSYNFNNSDTNLNLSLNGINANDITWALFDLNNQIYGDMTGTVNLTCNGSNFNRCMETLSGNTIFNVKDGKMPKLGSLEYLLKAGNLVKGGLTGISINSVIDLITPLRTGEFSDIYGSIRIKDGIARNIEITTKGKDLSLFIGGTYNFSTSIAEMEVLGLLSRKISTMFGPIGNMSVNTLFNIIPGIDLSKDSLILERINKIPGIELSDKAYRKFVAEIKGNINGNDYVTSFKWIN